MNLSELGLNRWGYKVVQQVETSDSSNMSTDIPTNKSQTEKETDNNSSGDASNIQPGTVIKSCIIISNELATQSLTFFDFQGISAGGITGMGTSSLGFNLSGDIDYEIVPSYFSSNYGADLGTFLVPWGTVFADTIGSPLAKTTVYGSVVACPLPTVPNALDVIRKIPEPTYVGERGHFGKRLYFDDETFPVEGLIDIEGKPEIEHTMMIGLLMKAVTELTKEVDKLKEEIALIKN